MILTEQQNNVRTEFYKEIRRCYESQTSPVTWQTRDGVWLATQQLESRISTHIICPDQSEVCKTMSSTRIGFGTFLLFR